MSNFVAHYNTGGFYQFNTLQDLEKVTKVLADGVELKYIEMNSIHQGNLDSITYAFLSLYQDITISVLDRLENGDFDLILDEMENGKNESVEISNRC